MFVYSTSGARTHGRSRIKLRGNEFAWQPVGDDLGLDEVAFADDVPAIVSYMFTRSPSPRPTPSRAIKLRRAPFYDADSTEEFLAMTFVNGPEGVTFEYNKPAKLRFFLGYVDDVLPGEGGSDQVTSLVHAVYF